MCVRSDIWLYAYIYNGYEAPPSGPGATVEPGPLNPEGSLLELMLAYWTDNYWKHKYRCYLNYWIIIGIYPIDLTSDIIIYYLSLSQIFL